MSGLAHIRNLVRQGAPATCDELREIVRIALDGVAGQAGDWNQRLSAALREILIGRHLHTETYQARAEALAVIDEISQRAMQSAG
jgi:hypothetical protein